MITGAVALQIVTNTLAVMDCDVLIENGTANLASSSNDTIIENDRVFDNPSAFGADTSADYGSADCTAGKNASAGNNGIFGLSALPISLHPELPPRTCLAVPPLLP